MERSSERLPLNAKNNDRQRSDIKTWSYRVPKRALYLRYDNDGAVVLPEARIMAPFFRFQNIKILRVESIAALFPAAFDDVIC